MRYVLIFFIRIYQKTPGRWHSYCKFQPTCSEYAIGVLREFGSIKGSYLAIKRIIKCNRFGSGGYDPIPINKGVKNEKD